MATYPVRYGETISDVVMNSTGLISNWEAILTANNFDNWTPSLVAGDLLVIPDGLPVDNDVIAQLTKYPANNASITGVYEKIAVIFTTMAGAEPATAQYITQIPQDTNTYYVVRYGETIGDAVMNSTGNIANWSAILNANGFDNWTPPLVAGQRLTIPAGVVLDLNTLRQLNIYEANNSSVPDVYDKINVIFGKMNPHDWILENAYWNDLGYWRDNAVWIDSL